MSTLLYIAIAAALILGTFAAAYEVYERHSRGPGDKERSFVLYVLGILAIGGITTALATWFALDLACPAGAGALCSFGVPAIAGLPAGIAGVAVYLLAWSRLGRSARTGPTS